MCGIIVWIGDVTERFKKSELRLTQSAEELILNAIVEKKVSNPNSVLRRRIARNDTLAEEQFMRLQEFVARLPDEIRSDISPVLPPIYCHLYLDAVTRGVRIAKHNIIRESLVAVGRKNPFLHLIDELPNIKTADDIASRPNVKLFRSKKHEVGMPYKSILVMRNFLSEKKFVSLLTVLHNWLDVEIITEFTIPPEEVDEDGTTYDESSYPIDVVRAPRPPSPAIKNYIRNMMGVTLVEKKYKVLTDAIRILRQSEPVPNPYFIYRLQNFENLCCASLHTKKKLMATGDPESEVRLWNLCESKLAPKRSYAIPLGCDVESLLRIRQDERCTLMRGHTGSVNGVSFMKKTDILLSVSHDCTMRAWNINDYTTAAVYRGHNYPLWCVAVSSLDKHIATGSQDRTARLWSLDRSHCLRVFAGHISDVNCVGFHPNNLYLATGSVDKTVRLWSVSNGNLVRVFVGHTGSVQNVALSPNGKFLASSGDGGRVKIWDIAGGGVMTTLKGNNSRTVSLAWSHCGTIVGSASDDAMMQLWDVEKAMILPDDPAAVEPIYTFESKCSQLLTIQFSYRNSPMLIGYNYPGENVPPPVEKPPLPAFSRPRQPPTQPTPAQLYTALRANTPAQVYAALRAAPGQRTPGNILMQRYTLLQRAPVPRTTLVLGNTPVLPVRRNIVGPTHTFLQRNLGPHNTFFQRSTPGPSCVSLVQRSMTGPSSVSPAQINTPGPSGVSLIQRSMPGPSGVSPAQINTPGPSGVSQVQINTPGPSGISPVQINTPGPSGVSSVQINTPGPSGVSSVQINTPGPSGVSQVQINTPGPSGVSQVQRTVTIPSNTPQRSTSVGTNTPIIQRNNPMASNTPLQRSTSVATNTPPPQRIIPVATNTQIQRINQVATNTQIQRNNPVATNTQIQMNNSVASNTQIQRNNPAPNNTSK
ncbi:TAF5-like RNA polymerase II p300/CBP-associated factor-associated factor 65 kDa subunit 5L isoform X3 [Nilaparvata lugens]|uniref:TAF5-like RNA polymerase II p300/CBP-associated factor-associated factor 65 kDa subunit 5L isoform X3 n=1 Tax=Nilaparvata lugens TaxID=108931 RepID=UPI00193E7246|nr:TAF5-like RNA polymerase II p300/CBP-associated factor-associated factor 65 kDa subunit 5L isoform X3 [Nilaparvata lugens]